MSMFIEQPMNYNISELQYILRRKNIDYIELVQCN